MLEKTKTNNNKKCQISLVFWGYCMTIDHNTYLNPIGYTSRVQYWRVEGIPALFNIGG